MNELLESAAARAARYLTGIQERAVAPRPLPSRVCEVLREPFPDGPSDAGDVLALLDELGSPATMGIAGPRFFGFVIGGSLPVGAGRELARDGLGPERGVRLAVARRLGARGGGAATGCARSSGCRERLRGRLRDRRDDGQLQLARRGAPRRARGPGLGRRGRRAVRRAADHGRDRRGGAPDADQGARPGRASGATALVRVPVDGQGRMRADALPPLSAATIVCAQAGNVNTGAFDPLRDDRGAHARGRRLAARRRRLRPVGGRGRAARAHLVEGVGAGRLLGDRRATSGSTCPYDSGLAFVRDAGALRAAMAVTADYLPAEPASATRPTTRPSSRAARAGSTCGRRCARSAARASTSSSSATAGRRRASPRGSAAAGYEILNDVVLNQVLVSFGEPAATQRVIAGVQADGTCWCGGTVWQGRTAMRISVSSWATTDDDVERSLAAILRVAQRLDSEPFERGCRRAARSSSRPGRPTTCSPSGRPSRSRPPGSDSAGQRSALNGFVSAFMRIVLSGPRSARARRARRRRAGCRPAAAAAQRRAPRPARAGHRGRRSPAARAPARRPRASSGRSPGRRLRVVREHVRARLGREERAHRAVVRARPGDAPRRAPRSRATLDQRAPRRLHAARK